MDTEQFELYIKNGNDITFSAASDSLSLLLPFDVTGKDEHIILDKKSNKIYINGFIFPENSENKDLIQKILKLCKNAKKSS